MTDEDKLIRQFLQESIPQPEDKGFSERVMHHLPRRPISMVWIAVCELVAIVGGCLFLLRHVDLAQVFCKLAIHVLQWAAYLRYIEFTFNPLYLVTIMILLTIWGGNRIKALT